MASLTSYCFFKSGVKQLSKDLYFESTYCFHVLSFISVSFPFLSLSLFLFTHWFVSIHCSHLYFIPIFTQHDGNGVGGLWSWIRWKWLRGDKNKTQFQQ